ncbi:dihydroorotate dehydrogenase electron transfer subunit [Desulfonauticus submarinus]|uniref:Dihydroorotate dehydrogenase electron transfer subunit n=1 Tax=Desulfonauticus submarinus TaxID=206665 RepID=A0A1H0D708_9BACT|nr:hypothetical protein [Desulfonauticus submarinus]SDN65855.1 dihydroorotate dehydrogenase electron transfer subunit [Desulfonauticus submarinus]
MEFKTVQVKKIVKLEGAPLIHLFLEGLDINHRAGQFVMLRPRGWEFDPLWPRPFSICNQDKDGLHIFLQVVGRGTRRLALLNKGDKIDCWGPIGNGFPIDRREKVLILCGGMGIAPFVSFCTQHQNPQNIRLIFGHRLDLRVYPWNLIPSLVDKFAFRQENEKDLKKFEKQIKQEIYNFKDIGKILVCGPRPFLKIVHKYAFEFKCADRVYLSLENRMACGVGACLGCVAKTVNGYVQTCIKGPVFKATELEEI